MMRLPVTGSYSGTILVLMIVSVLSTPQTAFDDYDELSKPTKEQRQVKACGITSDLNWVNWMESVETDYPFVFPKSDDELRDIVQAASNGGCKVNECD